LTKEFDEFLHKYKDKLAKELDSKSAGAASSNSSRSSGSINSREYTSFRKELLPPHLSWYEKACNLSEKVMKIKPDQKKEAEYAEAIRVSHLNITPTGAFSFSIIFPLLVMFMGAFLSAVIPIAFDPEAGPNFFFIMFSFMFGALLIIPLGGLPMYFASNWRMKASNQMVICVFYVVTYMRHTSNLERAIDFAAEHLAPPLSLDLRKVLWDVENGTYPSIKESLNAYLESWKAYNMEFVESFQLIESSLVEGNEDNRVKTLDKALSVMLEETYEKMLHYAQNLNSPITMLNMLGIILPILGMVILPLAVNFIEWIQWYHIAVLYNILIPLTVYYMGITILSTRPTGYGDVDITETNPSLKKYRNLIINIGKNEIQINPLFLSLCIAFIFLIIGLSPLIIHAAAPDFDFVFDPGHMGIYDKDALDKEEYTPAFRLLEYVPSKSNPNKLVGPFGLGAAILSVAFIFGIGISIGLYYKIKSRNVIQIRERTKELEAEFASALFQLGNRLGDNLPAEIAFSKVSAVMQNTTTGKFFEIVDSNIRRLGMSVGQAIFDPKVGAIINFPSSVIESSMKVLVESSKKGPKIAAVAVLSVSEYIKEIHRVDERLKDLLADVISSMKSQIAFLTPVISGIVVGISAMITAILNKLALFTSRITANTDSGIGGIGQLSQYFGGDGIPPYHLQLIIGFYVIEIVFIMVVLTNGIENGSDKLSEEYSLGKSLIMSTVTYCIVALIVILLFNIIAGTILQQTLTGR